jgi:hypothetical protein
MSGINGVLLETGFGNVLEFIFGVLFGLVAVSVFAVIVAGFIGLAGGIPTSAVAILFGAVLALWYLSENSWQQCLLANPCGASTRDSVLVCGYLRSELRELRLRSC